MHCTHYHRVGAMRADGSEIQLGDDWQDAVTDRAALYDGINAPGELTERYLRDRAAMLSWKRHCPYDDIQPESGPSTSSRAARRSTSGT